MHMTLYDLRNDCGAYSGIAAVCPHCGGPFLVEAVIQTGQCSLCESILECDVALLHPTDTDSDDEIVGDQGLNGDDEDDMMEIDVAEPLQVNTPEDYFMHLENAR